jgi:hypothetical protein
MTWGGGFYTTWPWGESEIAEGDVPEAVTPSGLTRKEVERQELEILAEMASMRTKQPQTCNRERVH